jgi:hypothetical protein
VSPGRDVFSPDVRHDEYFRREQLKITEMLEQQCRVTQEHCELAKASREALTDDWEAGDHPGLNEGQPIARSTQGRIRLSTYFVLSPPLAGCRSAGTGGSSCGRDGLPLVRNMREVPGFSHKLQPRGQLRGSI